jgi:hypothetical protein
VSAFLLLPGINAAQLGFSFMQAHPNSLEFIMKKISFAVLSVAVLASSSAFAEGKTRAQVYQELIEAQQNGLNYVTDSSYPEVSPLYAEQVARLKQQALGSSANASKNIDVLHPIVLRTE